MIDFKGNIQTSNLSLKDPDVLRDLSHQCVRRKQSQESNNHESRGHLEHKKKESKEVPCTNPRGISLESDKFLHRVYRSALIVRGYRCHTSRARHHGNAETFKAEPGKQVRLWKTGPGEEYSRHVCIKSKGDH